MRYGLAELADVIVEGAVDRFVGRPADANPYSEDYAEQAWHAWNFGWQTGGWYLEIRGQEEAARWLREAA